MILLAFILLNSFLFLKVMTFRYCSSARFSEAATSSFVLHLSSFLKFLGHAGRQADFWLSGSQLDGAKLQCWACQTSFFLGMFQKACYFKKWQVQLLVKTCNTWTSEQFSKVHIFSTNIFFRDIFNFLQDKPPSSKCHFSGMGLSRTLFCLRKLSMPDLDGKQLNCKFHGQILDTKKGLKSGIQLCTLLVNFHPNVNLGWKVTVDKILRDLAWSLYDFLQQQIVGQ